MASIMTPKQDYSTVNGKKSAATTPLIRRRVRILRSGNLRSTMTTSTPPFATIPIWKNVIAALIASSPRTAARRRKKGKCNCR